MPTPSIFCITNLNKGTHKNPDTIEAMAPASEYDFQKRDKIITGQKVAAIPENPNITNQNMVLSGEFIATIIAMINDNRAIQSVTYLDILVSFLSLIFGDIIC